MPLPVITQADVEKALRELGIRTGDGLLVHAALQLLGQPVGGPEIYLHGIQAVIGPEGTLVVPTFNFGFARGEDYDPASTPSQGMGVFAEWVRRQPGARRTTHPMQSLAALGARAEELAGLDTPSAFDEGSAFHRMLDHDFKLLLLGADVEAVSILHVSEQRANVPYRYWKEFSGRVLRGGEWQARTYRMFVRDEKINPKLVAKPIQVELARRGQWHAVKVNFGVIAACTLRDYVAATDALLAKDPWAFVVNR
ncbi:MAG: AAC(3) family N-acetyltransferase [Anaerolineae bacterium]|nr:MAG: AAC(3) family N-acetyltransferase [Anaerolineae bacterium]